MKKIYSLSTAIFVVIFFAFNTANSQVTVSGSTGLDGTYTSITLANGLFATLNAGGSQAGNTITVTITADLLAETGANSLDQGDWDAINISPSGGAWTISGAPAAGTPLLNFNGADNVTIEGLNTGGNALTISNTTVSSTAGTSTIRFINDATLNKIRNCKVLGSSTSTLATLAGTIVFGLGTTTGNDGIYITNCDIGPAGTNLPSKAIMSTGNATNAATRNSDITILNNNIYDFFLPGGSCAGMNILGGNDRWLITENRIYQTNTRTFTTTALRYSGIVINGGLATIFPGAFTIVNNVIGFGSNTQTGTTTITGSSNEFRGIDIPSADPNVVTSLQGNIISGINQSSSRSSTATTSSCFIAIGGGYSVDGKFEIGNSSGNQIGSTDGSSTIVINQSSTTASVAPVIGIYEFGDGSSKVSNNRIGYITINQNGGAGTTTGFRAMIVTTAVAGTTTEVKENVVTNITDNLVGGYVMYGITVNKAGLIYKNTVKNYVGNSNLASTVVMNGITASTTVGTDIIEKNDVHYLSNTCNNANLVANYGYDLTLPVSTANEVKQNYCYGLNINASNTSCQIQGMQIRASSSLTVSNNMICLGLKPDGTSITTATNIRGIQDSDAGSTATKNFYYNTVYITGSGVAAVGLNSFCFNSSSTGTREIKDNIFWNDRSNAVGGGTLHFAIAVAGAVVNPPGLTSDYNDLVATGTDGSVGLYNSINRPTLAAWQTATGQDANSVSIPVTFVNPAAGNLHLTGASIGDENLVGTPIPGIDIDIDKNERDAMYPYMGAHEANMPLPVELTSFTTSVNGNNVNLNWSTVSELNNSGFDIERSSNGVWTKVGNVEGNGNSTTTKNYSFTDRNVASGKYNYRLKQIDFNGHFEYFNLSNEVNVGVPERFELSQNYPNPFNPSTSINFSLPMYSKVNLKIYDMSGKEVATLINEAKTAGYYSVNFNASNLSSGIYFYSISAGDFSATKKMMLIK